LPDYQGHRRTAAPARERPGQDVAPASYAAPSAGWWLHGGSGQAQRPVMTYFPELPPVPSDRLIPHADPLRLAVAAYLARFKARSREYTESDLRCFLTWCAERGLDPLAARRPHLELYIRWMQEIRRFKPSTVSRRFSVAAGFYRTCVIDGVLEHSPAEHVRRPSVPPGSPTLGFTHLQFEALLTAACESPNVFDFALVSMLGLLGTAVCLRPHLGRHRDLPCTAQEGLPVTPHGAGDGRPRHVCHGHRLPLRRTNRMFRCYPSCPWPGCAHRFGEICLAGPSGSLNPRR
jgi:hypothetical protein